MTNETMTPEMNTVYENIKGSMVDNLPKLGKEWGRMVIAGEVYWHDTDPAKRNKASPKYQLTIKLDKPVYAVFNKFRGEGNRGLTGLLPKHNYVRVMDEDGNPVKENGKYVYEQDDMGEDKKVFSHYQVTTGAFPTKNDGTVNIIPVVDAATNKPVEGILAEGSKVAVQVFAYKTRKGGKDGIPAFGLTMEEIKVFEKVELSSEGSGGGDLWAAFGLSKTDVAAMAPPPPSAPSEPAEQNFEEEENGDKGSTPPPSSDLPDDEWDDDVPF